MVYRSRHGNTRPQRFAWRLFPLLPRLYFQHTADLHLTHLAADWASVEHVQALLVNQRRVSFEDAVTLDEAGTQHLADLALARVEIQVIFNDVPGSLSWVLCRNDG